MAALGKIRSKGVFLIIIIGLGLFGFIAGDMFKACEPAGRAAMNRAVVVFDEKMDIQEFQNYLSEYSEYAKIVSRGQVPADDELNQMAWESLKNSKLIEHECEELGITVTDQEFQEMMKKGTHPALNQLTQLGFADAQTGRFSLEMYKQFIDNYNKSTNKSEDDVKAYKALLFAEKQIRQNLLNWKYNSLLQECVLSNPYEAEFAFKAGNTESNVQLAYLDYKSVKDDEAKVSEEEIKSKYEELKEAFYIPSEMRDAKYILVEKNPSESDRAEFVKELNNAVEELRATSVVDSINIILRKYNSLYSYLGVPVTKNAFSTEVAAKLDSMSVGAVTGPVKSGMAGKETYSVVKLLGKTSSADSIEYRMIGFAMNPSKPQENVENRADSVLNALKEKGGENFDALSKQYNGSDAQKQWIATANYEKATSITNFDRDFINDLNNASVNDIFKIKISQGFAVVQVTNKKQSVTKYDVALLQRDLQISKKTDADLNSKLSQFVANNQTLESLVKNAKQAGYTVQDINGVMPENGSIPGIRGQQSREAFKWLFDNDREKGEVSKIFNETDQAYFVLAVSGIYPEGYLTLENPQVMEIVKQQAMKDKRAEKLMAQLKDVKSIEQAESKGAKVVDVEQITLSSPVVVTALNAQEPALSGAVARTAKGQFSSHPVKGNAGVYVFKVTEKNELPEKFDEQTKKSIMQRQKQENMSYFFSSNGMQQQLNLRDVERKAGIVFNGFRF